MCRIVTGLFSVFFSFRKRLSFSRLENNKIFVETVSERNDKQLSILSETTGSQHCKMCACFPFEALLPTTGGESTVELAVLTTVFLPIDRIFVSFFFGFSHPQFWSASSIAHSVPLSLSISLRGTRNRLTHDKTTKRKCKSY